MRKITQAATRALQAGKRFRKDNTQVLLDARGAQLVLHGNTIVVLDHSVGTLSFRLAGWPTPTTRERLNGTFEAFGIGLRVYQHKHEQYIQGGREQYGQRISETGWYTIDLNRLPQLPRFYAQEPLDRKLRGYVALPHSFDRPINPTTQPTRWYPHAP